jgi:hypothetical protein
MIALDTFAADAGIRHAFFTRLGGVSGGLFQSLNCGFGSGDSAENVAKNRAIAMQSISVSPEQLVTCRQIHSTTVVTVAAPWRREDAPRADGLVTRVPEIALGILAADCAPVLFCDPAARVVGAAHGGWRGALGGVIEATIAAMEALGAVRGRIRAAIGPCIGHLSYEVGPEFPAPIIAEDAAALGFFADAPQPGRHLFDLAGYIEHRLTRAGIAEVHRAGRDTVTEETLFFSYRRACLRGEAGYGRALSAIVLDG